MYTTLQCIEAHACTPGYSAFLTIVQLETFDNSLSRPKQGTLFLWGRSFWSEGVGWPAPGHGPYPCQDLLCRLRNSSAWS